MFISRKDIKNFLAMKADPNFPSISEELDEFTYGMTGSWFYHLHFYLESKYGTDPSKWPSPLTPRHFE